MKILLVNDDGYKADSLRRLAVALSTDFDVTVVAPVSNCSGFSNAITINKPVNIYPLEKNEQLVPVNSQKSILGFKLKGTPVDCAYIGLNTLFSEFPPDLVISGINEGENLAEDTLYSGTVAGAMEGFLSGIPSIAVSQQITKKNHHNFLYSAMLFKKILKKIIDQYQMPEGKRNPFLLNINIPYFFSRIDLPNQVEFTRLGRRKRSKPPQRLNFSDETYKSYLIGPHGDPPDFLEAGTDLFVMRKKKISITEMTVDLSLRAKIDNGTSLFENFSLDLTDLVNLDESSDH